MTPTNEWEKEFENDGRFEYLDLSLPAARENIKSYITNLLSTQKEDIIKLAEAMKREFDPDYKNLIDPLEVDGYNKALSDLITAIKNI